MMTTDNSVSDHSLSGNSTSGSLLTDAGGSGTQTGVMELYAARTLPPGEGLTWTVGRQRILVRRKDGEWLVAATPAQEGAEDGVTPLTEEEEGITWKRWVTEDGSDAVQLIPVMPERPVVVKPEITVKVMRGHGFEFFVAVPVWLSLKIGGDLESTVLDVPSHLLSNTWFGDPISGELCFAHKTRIMRHIESFEAAPQLALCPIRVDNHSKEELDFNKLCLRVDHASLYNGPGHLWSSTFTIIFLGREQMSNVTIAQEVPNFPHVGRLISPARRPFSRNQIKRTFDYFKTFIGF